MTRMCTQNVASKPQTSSSLPDSSVVELVTAPDPTPLVFVVDDDVSIRDSLDLLITSAGLRSETFASAAEFLSRPRATVPCCLVLDLTLPDCTGLELQQRLGDRSDMPIIFITGRGEVSTSVQAMKAGAIEFLTKPIEDDVLLEAIHCALSRSCVDQRLCSERRALESLYDTLSLREREVMGLVVTGMLNKLIGGKLGISEITVKVHRGQAMRKMKADSLPHLVTMAVRLGLHQ